MSLSHSQPTLAHTQNEGVSPSPFDCGSIAAPPPTPNLPYASTPEEDDGVHHECRPSPALGAKSRSGLPNSLQAFDKWMEKLLVKLNIQLVLQNSGSVARDHLASERTFLAYVRTSLTIATMGVALVQLFTIASSSSSTTISDTVRRVQRFARPLGATLVALGLAVLILGVQRYFFIQASLTKGGFPVARFGVAAITLVLAVIVIIVFTVLVSGRS